MNDRTTNGKPEREPGTVPAAPDASAASTSGDRTLEIEHVINRRIFETSLDLIVVVDRTGMFIRVSPSSEEILGYRPDEMTGRSAVGFIHEDDLDHTRSEMRQARRGSHKSNFESRYVHRDGRSVPIMWTGVWSEEEQQHFFIGRDMTLRIKLERQLRQANKMEAIGQLTGGIAHDFNNILGVIIGMSEILAERVSGNPQLADIVRSIDEAAERGAQLTSRMLAFARQQALQPRSLNLNDTVMQSAEILHRTLGDNVAVVTRPADDLWPVRADPSQIGDAILNLAINARDAMPRGGRLILETQNVVLDEHYAAQNPDAPPGDYVALVITDTGTGMAPDVVERAFDPFYTTKEPGRGTGLGLSMVHGFVKQSLGHVRIYSEVGHGTSVKIYLPRVGDNGDTADPAMDLPAEVTPAGRETVLVVEDADPVRDMVFRMLDSLGYRVLQAADGPTALAVLRSEPDIDLLFTDLVMPNGMSGQDLLVEARTLCPSLKAVFTSGYSLEFISDGDDAFADVPLLRKPYRKKDIAALVRNVLDGQS
jgi:PAS domain S-box-containing protein